MYSRCKYPFKVEVNLTESQRAGLMVYAYSRDKSMSEVVRGLIVDLIDTHKDELDAMKGRWDYDTNDN